MKRPDEVRGEFGRQWLEKAAADLDVARHLCEHKEVYAVAIAFHAQQAAEKAAPTENHIGLTRERFECGGGGGRSPRLRWGSDLDEQRNWGGVKCEARFGPILHDGAHKSVRPEVRRRLGPGGFSYAARRSQRWWRPPTSGNATISPIAGGCTARDIGVSFSSPRCVLAVW